MSDINFQAINENFPVAGEDNDTQTFRDNFDTIKRSLQAAKTEIEALEDPTTGAARLDTNNNFNLNRIENAVFQNIRYQVVSNDSLDLSVPIPIDYESGSYHVLGFSGSQTAIVLELDNLPGDSNLPVPAPNTLGKITLEMYSTDSKNIEFQTSGGTVIKKSPDFPDPLVVDSQTDPVFIEAWRHNADTIFMRYLGQFS